VSATVDHDEELYQLLRDAPLPLIASRIKRARKGSGLSHDKLGERCGMYRANLIGLEQGKHRPRLETVRRIAEATGRDPRWFLDPEVDPSPFPDDADGEG
jgi:transcriptional regulator with XRE-family HTH domain